MQASTGCNSGAALPIVRSRIVLPFSVWKLDRTEVSLETPQGFSLALASRSSSKKKEDTDGMGHPVTGLEARPLIAIPSCEPDNHTDEDGTDFWGRDTSKPGLSYPGLHQRASSPRPSGRMRVSDSGAGHQPSAGPGRTIDTRATTTGGIRVPPTMRRLATVALVTVTAVAASAAAAPRAEDSAVPADVGSVGRPNVLLIITDDQRKGVEVMPALKNRIRNGGTKYPNAYATTPVCCPSRSSIFTGKYSHNHEVVDNKAAGQLDPTTTIQHFLRKAGYRTGIVGKYLNSVRPKGPPSFNKSTVMLSKQSGKYYYGGRWTIDGQEIVTPKTYATSFIEKHALGILNRWDEHKDDKPWLLMVAPTAPHRPYTTLPEYEKAPVSHFRPTVEEDRSDKPDYVQNSSLSPRKGIKHRAAQYRALMPVNAMIENLMLSMKELDEKSNTIIIYMSDNALMWAEHGLRKKAVPYTEAVNVPLFLKWPGQTEPGSVDERLVGNIDLAPTILDAVGLESASEEMDGKSLLDPLWDRDRIHLEFLSQNSASGPWASTRAGSYQYTEYYGRDGIVDFREYYDIESDPEQLVNVLEDANAANDPNPEELLQLQKQLQHDLVCSENSCP